MRALVTLLMCTLAFPAVAQPEPPKCGPTEALRAQNKKIKWKEVEVTAGLMTGGKGIISVFVSPLGETWTIMVTGVTGTSCIVAQGTHWMQGEVPTGDPA